jgi:hypothetical protein
MTEGVLSESTTFMTLTMQNQVLLQHAEVEATSKYLSHLPHANPGLVQLALVESVKSLFHILLRLIIFSIFCAARKNPAFWHLCRELNYTVLLAPVRVNISVENTTSGSPKVLQILRRNFAHNKQKQISQIKAHLPRCIRRQILDNNPVTKKIQEWMYPAAIRLGIGT